MNIPHPRGKCKPLLPFCRHFVTFSASFPPPGPLSGSHPCQKHQRHQADHCGIGSVQKKVFHCGSPSFPVVQVFSDQNGFRVSGPRLTHSIPDQRRCVKNSGPHFTSSSPLHPNCIRAVSEPHRNCIRAVSKKAAPRVPGAGRQRESAQNAHSPFSKMVTVSPVLVTPVTRVSGAPIITSSWIAESFRPFSISWARVMALPPLMLVG